MTGYAIALIGFEPLENLMASRDLSPETLLTIRNTCAQCEVSPEELGLFVKREFAESRWTVTGESWEKVRKDSERYYERVNKLLGINFPALPNTREEYLARQAIMRDVLLAALRVPLFAALDKEYDLDSRLAKSDAPYAAAIGRTMLEITGKFNAYLRGIQIRAAINMFRKDNADAPDSLEQLCPRYLKELPDDPFSGKPFRYQKKDDRWRFWSVGPNLKDDGGVFDESKRFGNPDDIVFPDRLKGNVERRSASPDDIAAEAAAAASAEMLVEKLAKKYALTIVVAQPQFPVKTAYGPIEGRQATQEAINHFVPILAGEWNLYPAELIKKTGLRRIILCEKLSYAGERRTAIPDFEHLDYYLDVREARYDEPYERHCIHQQLFYLIDWCQGGYPYSDDGWSALNPKGFKYGTGGENAQGDYTAVMTDDSLPGFMNKYSMTGVEEDKAEMYAYMVVEINTVEKRAATDKVIRAKMQRIKEILDKVCSKVDESFWDEARKLNRSEPPEP